MCARRFLYLTDVNDAIIIIFGKFSWFCCCDCRCRRFCHRLFLSVHPSTNPYYFSPHRSQFGRVEWDTNLIEYSKWYFIIEFFEMCTGAHLTVLCMYQKLFAVFHHLIHNVNSSIQWWFYSYSNETYTHAHISWCVCDACAGIEWIFRLVLVSVRLCVCIRLPCGLKTCLHNIWIMNHRPDDLCASAIIVV